jgi:predicted  nucleic acid-binding Zn-ribbon protein
MKTLITSFLVFVFCFSCFGQKKTKPPTREQLIERYWSAYKTNTPAVVELEKQISVLNAKIKNAHNEFELAKMKDEAEHKKANKVYSPLEWNAEMQTISKKESDLTVEKRKLEGQVESIKVAYIKKISPHLPPDWVDHYWKRETRNGNGSNHSYV